MNVNPLSDCEKTFILEAASQKIVSTFLGSCDLFEVWIHILTNYFSTIVVCEF